MRQHKVVQIVNSFQRNKEVIRVGWHLDLVEMLVVAPYRLKKTF